MARYSKEELEKQKQERLGEVGKNNFGTEVKIIEYNSYSDIIVEFQDEYKYKKRSSYEEFRKGKIKNPYDKEVCNVGFYGIGNYKSRDEDGKKTEVYKVWCDMLRRCYDPYILNKEASYIDCFVCEEWHNFQNFADWYYKNIYNCNNEKMYLDKDILYKGNKIYSPKTCVLVTRKINNLFTRRQNHRGEYPIGVCYHKENNNLIVHCNIGGKSNHLGCFPLNRPFQAFYTYKIFKENYIKQVADEYKDLIPKKLYDAMYNYEVEIND